MLKYHYSNGGEKMNLSIEQEEAVNHMDGPALVLAVPGAGKTTVLIHRTMNIIKKCNIHPNRILSITFSKASALDMRQRFLKTFPEYNYTGSFSTIHSFCFGLIREYSFINKIKLNLIEEENHPQNKYSLLKKIFLDFNKEYITEEKLETLINSIGYIKNMMISPEEFIKNNKVDFNNFIDLFNTYEKYKRENNLIDFDDMLTISLEILQSNKYILDKYRQKYDYFQLDEGQDTSKIQLEIIKILAYPNNNLFIVADDDQSIYGFRGAYPKALLQFNKIFKNGKIYFMERNYRSSKNIVHTCNKFIKTNVFRYNKDIMTDNSYFEPINIIKVKNISDQYKILLDELKDRDLSQCCILYRNNLTSVGIIELLEKNHIPFYMRDNKLKFFNHWLIKDILFILKFSEDVSNIDLYEQIYYKTKGYISKKHINFAKTLDSSIPILDRIVEYPGINDYYKRNIRELKLDFKRISKLKPYDAIKYIDKNMEYGDYLREHAKRMGYSYDTLRLMVYYLLIISDSAENLSDFIGRLKHLKYLSENAKNNIGNLTLSTIHSAKGLEFERVYMIDLIDGEFPSLSSIEDYENGILESLEEERRLFYVGMTRAKTHLTLIASKYIEEATREQSRFLTELEQIN